MLHDGRIIFYTVDSNPSYTKRTATMGPRTPQAAHGLVARPSSRTRRISFAEEEEEEDILEISQRAAAVHDVLLKDIQEGEEQVVFKTTRSWRGGLRKPSRDQSTVYDEVDNIFDDVFATPEERSRQVSMTEISLKNSTVERPVTVNDPPSKEDWSTSFKFQAAVVSILVLALIGVAIRGSTMSDSDKVTATPENDLHAVKVPDDEKKLWDEVTVEMEDANDVPGKNIRRMKVSDDEDKLWADLTVKMEDFIAEPNDVPGNDIQQYLIGYVNQSIDPEEIHVLLAHDLTKDMRVVCGDACDDATLDTLQAKIVSVDEYELQCGVKVDNVPLTLICNAEQCGVYFVGASYCDQYE